MADPVQQASVDTVDADARRRLIRLLRAAYPHPRIPDGPYERTADAVIDRVSGSLWQRLALTSGLASLDAKAGGDFLGLEQDAAYRLLVEIENAEFFKLIRSVAVVSLYNDAETWDVLGYEGPSFEFGGYLHRGFDDLDWLPTPRIEEYDGPDELVTVAAHDQPAAGGSR